MKRSILLSATVFILSAIACTRFGPSKVYEVVGSSLSFPPPCSFSAQARAPGSVRQEPTRSWVVRRLPCEQPSMQMQAR